MRRTKISQRRTNKQRKPIPFGARLMLAKQQGGKCGRCGYPLGDDTVVDHIIHHCRGGVNARWNLQLVHADCNQARGVKWL